MFSLNTFLKGLLLQNEIDRSKELILTVSPSATTNTSTTIVAAQTADVTVTLPNTDLDLNDIVTTDSVSVLTNKTIDPADNMIVLQSSHILVGDVSNGASDVGMTGAITINNSGVTSYAGTVPLNKGGTGQVTANASLNALLPSQSTQTGKVLTTDGTNSSWQTVSGSGTVTNVATGTGLTGGPITTTGTIALANTAVTPASYTLANITVDQQGRVTAASNGTSSVASLNVVSTSTNHTALNTEDVILVDATTGNKTITMYSASGNSGKVIRIKKTDNIDNKVIISGLTVDGFSTLNLWSQYEEVTLVSNGTTFNILDHYINGAWINGGTIGFNAVSGAAPIPANTATQNIMTYRRDGSDCIVRYEFSQPNGTGGSDGTDFYLLLLPAPIGAAGGAVNSVIGTIVAATTTNNQALSIVTGMGLYGGASNERRALQPVLFDGSNVGLYIVSASGAQSAWGAGSGGIADFTAKFGFSVELRVRVSGWLG